MSNHEYNDDNTQAIIESFQASMDRLASSRITSPLHKQLIHHCGFTKDVTRTVAAMRKTFKGPEQMMGLIEFMATLEDYYTVVEDDIGFRDDDQKNQYNKGVHINRILKALAQEKLAELKGVTAQ